MREGGQERGVGGEDVRGVEEGRGFVVNAGASAQESGVEGSFRRDREAGG